MDFIREACNRCFCFWLAKGDIPLYVSTSLASLCTLGEFKQVILCLDSSLTEMPRNFLIQTYFSIPELEVVSPEDLFDSAALDKYSQLRGKYFATNRADFYRIYVLFRYGGFYCDVDTMVIRPFSELPFTTSYAPQEDSNHVNNSILFAERGHPVFKFMYENFMLRWTPDSFNEVGPLWFSEFKDELCIDTAIHHHYLIHWRDWKKLFIPTSLSVDDLLASDVFSVHLWGTMLRRNHFYLSPDFVRAQPRALYSKLVEFTALKGSEFCKELI